MRISYWSSDVCSSDLFGNAVSNVSLLAAEFTALTGLPAGALSDPKIEGMLAFQNTLGLSEHPALLHAKQRFRLAHARRSEERRVGKECVSPCRSRWSPSH